MSEEYRIDLLIAEARVLEDLANSIAAVALVHRNEYKASDERAVWSIVRSRRIQALLAYGQAAALLGCVVSVDDPER